MYLWNSNKDICFMDRLPLQNQKDLKQWITHGITKTVVVENFSWLRDYLVTPSSEYLSFTLTLAL